MCFNPKAGPEGNCPQIDLTRGDLRNCCLTLVPNGLREVKVTYSVFNLTTGRVSSLDMRMGQEILEPLKLLKGVGKVTLLFNGLVSPDYRMELVQAMTSPKAGPTAAEQTDAGKEDVGEQPGSTTQHGGREGGNDLGQFEAEREQAGPSTKKCKGGERV